MDVAAEDILDPPERFLDVLGVDEDCNDWDFIVIPDAVAIYDREDGQPVITGKRFCGESIETAVVRSSPSGPRDYFMIKFKSDDKFEELTDEIGFQMVYSVY